MLKDLAVKYGTDKTEYARIYDALLRDRRYTTRSVLEIGIGDPQCMAHISGYKPGASLRMWKEYFPHAGILGADINPHEISESRIRTIVANQQSPSELRELTSGQYDLIVDDGSHASNHQISSCRALWPHLVSDGIYIIEDVNHLNRVYYELRDLDPFIIGVEPSVQEVCARALVMFK